MDGVTLLLLLEAEDQEGRRVVVRVSSEALQHFGLDAVRDRASEKFDAKDFGAAGRIVVATPDFF